MRERCIEHVAYVAMLWALLVSSCYASSGDVTPLLIDKERIKAAPAIRYLRPLRADLLLEDILPSSKSGAHWQLNTGPTPNFGFGPSVMWFWVPIHNPSDQIISRFVEIQNPVLDEVILFQVTEDERLLSRQQTGDRFPMSERPVDHYNLILPIQIGPQQTQHLYFKVMTAGSMQLPLTIWDTRYFYKADQIRLLGFGIFFGVLVVMAIYNLFVFSTLQDRVFLYYAGYALSLVLFEFSINGFGNQYFWSDSPWWREHSVSLFVPILVSFGALFTRSFMQLKLSNRRLYRLFGVLFHSALACAVLSIFIPYSVSIKVSAFLALPVALLSVAVGLYRWFSGYIPARYFILAYALFLLSVVAYSAGKFGILPENVFTSHAMQLGAMLGSIVSAFALTDRVNRQRMSYMTAQKNALNMQKAAKQDLEKTVDERTRTLQNTLSQLEDANEKLQSLSFMDGLTGIKNRRYFDEKIAREWSRATRNNAPISLLAIDIDHFKRFNDDYGHLIGDACLRHVAHCIDTLVSRTTDFVARYGGEEFMVILPDTEIEGASHIAEEIRVAIEDNAFLYEGEEYRLTVSVGVSCIKPVHGELYQALVSEADRALYRSKKNGRNCVTVF